MNSKKVLSKLGFILIIFGLATLACNIPETILLFQFEDTKPETLHTIVADYEATVVNEEGEILGMPIIDYTEWVCKDIQGEVSMLQAGEGETMIIKKADLNLNIKYRRKDPANEIVINYLLDIERDEGYIGKENKIENWNHAKWVNSGTSSIAHLNNNWVFGTYMNVTVIQEDTYPNQATFESEKNKSFFGLISFEDYRNAYLCDVGANPLPDGWENATEKNFRGLCHHWYYECTATKP